VLERKPLRKIFRPQVYDEKARGKKVTHSEELPNGCSLLMSMLWVGHVKVEEEGMDGNALSQNQKGREQLETYGCKMGGGGT
jgi:hypothetical protein